MIGLAFAPGGAAASTAQLALFQAGQSLLSDPMGTLTQLQALGVGIVRVTVSQGQIAPQPTSSSPSPVRRRRSRPVPAEQLGTVRHAVVREAQALGIRVDFTVGGGAPLWAQGQGNPAAFVSPVNAWQPLAGQFGLFVRAVGTRYRPLLGAAASALDSAPRHLREPQCESERALAG